MSKQKPFSLFKISKLISLSYLIKCNHSRSQLFLAEYEYYYYHFEVKILFLYSKNNLYKKPASLFAALL